MGNRMLPFLDRLGTKAINPSAPPRSLATAPTTVSGRFYWSSFRGALHYSPDGKFIASGSADLSLREWDSEAGKMLRSYHCPTAGGSSLAYSPDGIILASAGGPRNRDVWLFDTTSSLEGATLTGHTKVVRSLAFSADGSFLATAGDDAIRLWTRESPGRK